MSEEKASPIGTSWQLYRENHFTAEERMETDIKVALIGEIINARQAQGFTQKQIEELSGVKQPIIARMERGTTDPQISTVLKVLHSLGKTLQIVDLDQKPRL